MLKYIKYIGSLPRSLAHVRDAQILAIVITIVAIIVLAVAHNVGKAEFGGRCRLISEN